MAEVATWVWETGELAPLDGDLLLLDPGMNPPCFLKE
jgi:hypothetical protein